MVAQMSEDATVRTADIFQGVGEDGKSGWVQRPIR
jgi:hypothetical protein